MINELTAPVFASLVRSGSNELTNCRATVDALNVFPVPDGDTGTNMSLTLKNAALHLPDDASTAEAVALSVASYTLRGARGNSGVILSQIFRGIANASKGKTVLSTADFAACLSEGATCAYRAVMKPTEGTILTIIRTVAQAACEDTPTDFSLLFHRLLKAGEEMLKKTTDMLPALSNAGVVDAGGSGLMAIIRGMAHYIETGEITPLAEDVAEEAAPLAQAATKTQDIRFTYCTEFIIEKSSPAIHADKLKESLSKVGDSMVVIDDDDIIKVHIHTNMPGFVLEHAVRLGELSTVKIENMKKQHSSLVNGEKTVTEPSKDKPEKKASRKAACKMKNACLSVASGDGVIELFRNLGAAAMIEGGQTMNPSTEDILSAIETVDAEVVYVLPNNSNIVLSAKQAADIAKQRVVVVETTSIPEGIAAMVAFDPLAAPDDNKKAMTDAAKHVSTGLVTHAVRDTTIDEKDIHEGDVLGLSGKAIINVSSEVSEAAEALVAHLITENSSLITVIYGEDVTEEAARAFADCLEEAYPACDISLYAGGQPVYDYMLGVE